MYRVVLNMAKIVTIVVIRGAFMKLISLVGVSKVRVVHKNNETQNNGFVEKSTFINNKVKDINILRSKK
jgi:hypothetical protein